MAQGIARQGLTLETGDWSSKGPAPGLVCLDRTDTPSSMAAWSTGMTVEIGTRRGVAAMGTLPAIGGRILNRERGSSGSGPRARLRRLYPGDTLVLKGP